MGGYSNEFEISLKSGAVVAKNLPDIYNSYCIHILKDKWVYVTDNGLEIPINKADFSLEMHGKKINFDCVFNAIHGSPGEDGLMQSYFKLLGIPQTSSGAYQAAITFNKRDCLSILKTHGIPTAKSYLLNLGDPINSKEILAKVGLPCFVKPNRSGSSFGIQKVHFEKDLKLAIKNAFTEDSEIIIESFLDGQEVTVGVITFNGKIKVLPITEIISENDFFDYEAKYLGKSKEITPARISDAEATIVSDYAIFIYKILGLKGFSRSEFIFVDGMPHLIEINTVPGLTEKSILPQQAAKAGISLRELFQNAIEEALTKN